MAWFYTVVLAACSAGILGAGVALTRRLFRDELITGSDSDENGRAPLRSVSPDVQETR